MDGHLRPLRVSLVETSFLTETSMKVVCFFFVQIFAVPSGLSGNRNNRGVWEWSWTLVPTGS